MSAKTIKTETKTETNTANDTLATFGSLAQQLATSIKNHENKATGLVSKMVELGYLPSSLTKENKEVWATLTDACARAYLSKAQFAAWGNMDLATKKNGVLTERGEAMAAVSSARSKFIGRFKKFYAELVKAETPASGNASTNGATQSKGAKTRGASASMDQTVKKQCDAWVKRIEREKDRDSFNIDCDPIALRAALLAVIKVVS